VDGVVRRARIGLGGVAATPLRALATEAALEGRPWSEDVVREAAATMRGEGTPMDDHRASSAYRSAMLATSLLRLFAENPPGRALDRQEVGA
jgi:xanthine dehydrogenase small subunit